MRRLIALGIVGIALAGALSCCCCGSAWNDFVAPITEELDGSPTLEVPPTAVPSSPTPAADAESPDPSPTEVEPSPTPSIAQEPSGDLGDETAELLASTTVPVRDLHDLAIRLLGLPADTPRTINPAGSPDYPVGTNRIFHVSNVDTDEQFDIDAILAYKTEHVYMWVEEGVDFDQDDLAEAADLFEDSTYPTNRAFFGEEWSPGVDNDPHVSILHATNLGSSVAGYYSSASEFVSSVRGDSNEMEMFYINVTSMDFNGEYYNAVLAHEFQHMIHWYKDRNEETWLNEGFSELAMFLNGMGTGGADWAFANTPDTQINSWPEPPAPPGANYGGGYLFTSYFLDRFGAEATQALVSHQENGLTSVDAVLSELGLDITHQDFFADWIVANILDDPDVADGRYEYAAIDLFPFEIAQTYDRGDYPVSSSGDVHQYATDYVELRGSDPLTLRFAGSTQVGLMDTIPRSGQYLWWSNRGDDSDVMLTRAFDLSAVSEATLEFWTWYDLEEDWDYAYVEISSDGGETWEILTTPSGTPENPNGNSFGFGYTGRSGGAEPSWIQEAVDLSPYVGQEVLVRFEVITDDAVNRPGFALDDVAIPEIGYFSNFDTDGDGWEAAGFVRHANVLRQRWLVQLVLFGSETTVERLELEAGQTGEWTVPLDRGARRAIVTISGLAPVTTELATYSYQITPGASDVAAR
jgi:immune inhibitor A